MILHTHLKDQSLAYQESGDMADREEVILRHVPLVHYTLGKLGISRKNYPDYDDLTGQGILGLIDAFDRFGTSYNTRFSTYASIKVRGKVLDYLRSIDWMPRTTRQKVKRLNESINAFWNIYHRMPTDEELAKQNNTSVEEVQQLLADSNRTIVSLDASDRVVTEDVTLYEIIQDEGQSDPIDIVGDEEIKMHLMLAITSLPERDQQLLSLYYYENLTFKEIGEVLALSESRVSQLHTRCMAVLKGMMAGDLGDGLS